MRFFYLRSCSCSSSEWGSCYPPISYPHVILLLHLKSLWPALLKQDLCLETWVLWYFLRLHQIITSTLVTTTSPRELYLHLCTFRVLKYVSSFACICILPSAEQSRIVSWSHASNSTLNWAWELDILTSAWWLCVCSRFHLNKKPGGPLSYSDYDYLSVFVYYSLSKPGMFVLVLFESL